MKLIKLNVKNIVALSHPLFTTMDAAALSNQIPALAVAKPLLSNNTSNNSSIIKPQPNPSNSITVAVSNGSRTSQCKYVVRAFTTVHSKRAFIATDVFKPAFRTLRKAATGYAAALLDAVCCELINFGGILLSIEKDTRKVKMIARAVLEDESVKEEKKGCIVRKVVERGNLNAKLAVMVRTLVAKGKVEAVEEVMDEFIHLWEDLCESKESFW